MRQITPPLKTEGGQALILFTLALCVLLLSAMAVVDVGFFLHNRENAQQAADAAALAGAQDLPASPSQAQADALSYITKNGLSTANTTITFTCTSQVSQICTTSNGKYDTIIVKQSAPSPTYFGGVLSIIGVNNCWVTGCTASATAAGCRGACGPVGTGPADIVTVMDHSASMSPSNIQNSKNAITTMFTNFDSTYQKVALAVTPPVKSTNNCNSIVSWSDTPKVWLPGALTSGFQTSPHVLNNSSPPVSVEKCVTRTAWNPPGELTDYPLCSCHTDLGSPIKAAKDELAANGRANVKWGMVIVTDGAANVAPTTTISTPNTVITPGDTGWRDCASSGGWAAITTNSGDNNGYEGTPGKACDGDNNQYATDTNSGTSSTQTACPDTTGSPNEGGAGANGKDKEVFSNFGVTLPGGATFTGLEVMLRAKVDSTTGVPKLCVQVSNDNGATWSAAQSLNMTGNNTEMVYNFGSSADFWGKSWTATTLDNSHLKVRVTDVAGSTARDFSLDEVAVRAHYTTSTTTYTTTTVFNGSKGPCDWASTQATAAKALGIEIFVIGFGVPTSEKCSDFAEDPSSPFYNTQSSTFLQSLATDSSHYYNQPKSSDLTPIFSAIGSQLTSGSRLVSCSGC